MVSFIHQGNDVHAVPFFKVIDATHVLADAPDSIVREAERGANGDMTGNAVRNEGNRFAEVVLAEVTQQLFDAQPHLPHRFPAGEADLAGGFEPRLVKVGIPGANVLARQAFPRAIINIQEVGAGLNRKTVHGGKRLGGLDRTREGTGIDRVEFEMGEPLGNAARLGLPGFVQWNVRATAKAIVFVPFRLTMTNEQESCTNERSLAGSFLNQFKSGQIGLYQNFGCR